jgi:hypothetical protein
VNINVTSLEGFNKRLRHSVGLRAAHRREAGDEAEFDRKVDRLVGPIAAAIVREPLDRMRQSLIAEALLDTFHHQIPDHFSGDAAGAGAPGHDFSVAGIECKGDSNDLPLQQAISKPSEVQRRFGLIVMILPSCARPGGLPV